MALVDLGLLAKQVQDRFFREFNPMDCILPDSFKELYNSENIEYNKYSLIVNSSSLKIYIPNQWIYIAYYFVEYYKALKEYRDIIINLCYYKSDKDSIKNDQGNADQARLFLLLHKYSGSESDRELLVKFLSDYSWWSGAKTIDRNDFYMSPILSLSQLVNASQSYVAEICKNLGENTAAYEALDEYVKFKKNITPNTLSLSSIDEISSEISYSRYLTAMRTKPFLLLAGISGTGKSRIVKEMAFASCPPDLQDAYNVSPGNYCMIEVKPNWHDSSELLGFVSHIGGEHYVSTPFINFLIKAWHNPETPFFVCLDEMNLAPVEQYFAEFLSVLESRKLNDDKNIVSEPIIKADVFRKHYDDFKQDYFKGKLTNGGLVPAKYAELWKKFGDNGLSLPPNIIVIGTVNMDETTYQFSRKVIDRAMTIEMNEVNFNSIFEEKADTLRYRDDYAKAVNFLPKFTAARDALEVLNETDSKFLKNNLPRLLENLDKTLINTPFRIAYRVQNELILYFTALREEQRDADTSTLLTSAVDDILMMKVLPRIEGGEDLLGDNDEGRGPLSKLFDFTAGIYEKSNVKIKEMQSRLNANHFTSFWP